MEETGDHVGATVREAVRPTTDNRDGRRVRLNEEGNIARSREKQAYDVASASTICIHAS